ncbi:MAG: potassium channel beta subunit family protein [Bacteroidales bacterium]
MKYNFLGRSGLKVSALSFGSWVTFGFQADTTRAMGLMKKAYEHGVNFFDNAEQYAGGMSETIMGQVLKKTGWKRSDLVLSTKIFWGGDGPNDQGLSMKHIIEGTNAALKRLQVEYVDLIFCHRPDKHTPVEETVRAMNQVINQGKAFYWGTSEWSAAQIKDAWHFATENSLIPPLMEQPEYNMFRRHRVEVEYQPLYAGMGLGTTIWSPLASGVLTNKYAQGIPDDSRLALKEYEWLRKRIESPEGKEKTEKATRLKKIADELGVSLPQMSIAWCLKNPAVSTVITGASKSGQIDENMKALDVIPMLDKEIMEKIELVLDNKPPEEKDWRTN